MEEKHKVEIGDNMREGKGKGCGCGHWQKLRMGVGFCREKAEEEIPSPEPKLSYAQPRKKKVAIIIEGPGKHEERERERERGAVLGKAYGKIREMFEMKEELGRGRFGVTYRCMEKTTGREYACKSIAKKRSNGENVRREVMILQHVSGQDKIVELKGAYEDANNVHLVMELCTGGELFHRILSRGRGAHSEPEAASIISQILSALHACHVMGVIHRDIKPENFLFTTSHPDSPLKLTDFGSSLFFHKHQLYTDFVANAYYLPPEVFKRSYGKEIDIWNAGVILYILLTGFPPFSADTEKGMYDAISGGYLDMDSAPWPSISAAAKDLVTKMLTYDPKHRITAADALEHEWLKEGGEASDKHPRSAVLNRMERFRDMNLMKKLTLKVIAENLSKEETEGLREMFNNMDTDGSGTITFEELKSGLSILGSQVDESEIRKLMNAIDVDKNGSIDYYEFVGATMDGHKVERGESLYKAFQWFDKDDNGYITRDEFREAIAEHQMGDEAAIATAIDEVFNQVNVNFNVDVDVDSHKDGKINYEQFKSMMRNQCPITVTMIPSSPHL